jgi:hypothetical protein
LLVLYEQKAEELSNLLLALVEEKANGMGAISRNFRQREEALDAIAKAIAQKNDGELDECSKKKIDEDKAQLKRLEAKELGELDRDLGLRKADRERELTTKALERENKAVQELQAVQLAERRRVVEEKLHGALVQGLLEELNDADAEDMRAFEKEQEIEL